MMKRRRFVQGVALLASAPLLRAQTELPAATRSALEESDVVYLTPLKSNGEESRCKAEIWFVAHQGGIYVVTSAEAWRARAVRQGLNRARVWVGEFGAWTKANDAFRNAPTLEVSGQLVTESNQQSGVLDAMGAKYRLEWVVWGPRFRNGLADGTRVMIRYLPTA